MDTTRVHHEPATFTLTRVYRDGTTEIVEGTTTTDRIEATETAYRLMRAEPGSAFTLYAGSTTIAKFGHKTLKLRLKVGAIEMMVG